MENKINPVKISLTAGAMGASAGAISAFVAQKKVLNNPDVFIKKYEETIAKANPFNVPKPHLDKALETVKKFAEGGKFDFRAIRNKALIFGVLAGATAGIIAKIHNSKKAE